MNFIKRILEIFSPKIEPCKLNDSELQLVTLCQERARKIAKHKLKPCFHCGKLFTSKYKWANDAGPHMCHHGHECGIFLPKCLECATERHKLHELFR